MLFNYTRYVSNSKVIVGMTSWPNRIQFIQPTIFSIINQVYTPDLFYLILSEKEFPNKEKDLPQYILDFKNQYNFFKIEWTTDNLKNFKKNIPLIRKYFNDTSVVLYIIDDDIYYKKFYINDTLKRFEKLNQKNPTVITWNFPWTNGTWNNDPEGRRLVGSFEILKPQFFKPIVYSITESDLNRYEYLSEDNWISYNLQKNKITFELLPYNNLMTYIEYTNAQNIDALSWKQGKIEYNKILGYVKNCYDLHSKSI